MNLREITDSLEEKRSRVREIRELLSSDGEFDSKELLDETKQLKDEIVSLEEQRDSLTEAIGDLNDLDEKLSKSTGRTVKPAPVDRSERSFRVKEYEDDGTLGFRHLGEFAMTAMNHKVRGKTDERLSRAATTYGSEAVGQDGGYAVPTQFVNNIMEQVIAESSLLGSTDLLTTSTNSVTVPVDETTPWQSSGGIIAEWGDEGSTATERKPKLNETLVKLHKCRCLVKMTDESLADSTLLNSYLTRKVPTVIDFKISEAIIAGTGAGQPLGVINAPATISVAKVASQDADTIVGQNVLDMFVRLYQEGSTNAKWYVNPDCREQMMTLQKVGKDDTGTTLATEYYGTHFTPVPGAAGSAGTLLGLPIVYTQACETLGDAGDIVLADLSHYLGLVKGGGVTGSTSMHLHFDQDITTFKFVLRVGGQPWWGTTISPLNGSTTYSPFVTLAARA